MYVIQNKTELTIDYIITKLRNRKHLEELGEMKRKSFVKKTIARQIRQSKLKLKEVVPVEINDNLERLKYVVRPYNRKDD